MSEDPNERALNHYIDHLGRWELECEDVYEEALSMARSILRAYCDHVEMPTDGSEPKEVGLSDDVIAQYTRHLFDSELKDSPDERNRFAVDLAERVTQAFADSGGEGPLHWDW